MMLRPVLSASMLLAAITPAAAQTHQGHGAAAHDAAGGCTPEHEAMGHCVLPPVTTSTADARADPGNSATAQDTAKGCTPDHAAMGHCSLPPMATPEHPLSPSQHNPVETPHDPQSGHADHKGQPKETSEHDVDIRHGTPQDEQGSHAGSNAHHGTGGTALMPGNGPAPVPPVANYADRVWGADAMTHSRQRLRKDHGGGAFSQVMFDVAEYRAHKGRDGFHWGAEGWFGGDINRLVVKSEGSIALGSSVEDAEVQALYSRAIGPYFNLQAGVRHDIKPNPSRTYGTIGFEGLAPYWFEVEGQLFLSDKGDVLARLGAYYDQRITQRWILQPSAELNFAAQDMPEQEIGSGLSTAEMGLRLRYEIAREFAPYIGVTWERSFGDTARLARISRDDADSTSLVIGVRAWF